MGTSVPVWLWQRQDESYRFEHTSSMLHGSCPVVLSFFTAILHSFPRCTRWLLWHPLMWRDYKVIGKEEALTDYHSDHNESTTTTKQQPPPFSQTILWTQRAVQVGINHKSLCMVWFGLVWFGWLNDWFGFGSVVCFLGWWWWWWWWCRHWCVYLLLPNKQFGWYLLTTRGSSSSLSCMS